MSRGSERALRKRLRAAVQELEPGAHVVQVENPLAGAGTPDTYLCVRGVGVWVELKHIPLPKRPTTPLRLDHLRTGQVQWMAAERRAGGRAWVLLQAGDTYYLLHPRTALDVQARKHTAGTLPAASDWHGATLQAWSLLHTAMEVGA